MRLSSQEGRQQPPPVGLRIPRRRTAQGSTRPHQARAPPCARLRTASAQEDPVAFNSTDLAALIQGNNFPLWHSPPADTRATVAATGYFAPVADRLRAGDLMILQAADAMAMLP